MTHGLFRNINVKTEFIAETVQRFCLVCRNSTALLSGGRYMPLDAVTALNSIHSGLVLRPSCVPEKLGCDQKGVNQK